MGPSDRRSRPFGHELPQIITEGVLRRGLKSNVITFKLRVLRLIELSFVVALPEQGKTRVPIYVRFFIDRSQEDKPGTVLIEEPPTACPTCGQ